VPFLAIIAYKLPNFSIFISLIMIFANFCITIVYSYTYDLKIGFLNAHNFFMLESIIGKPWTKL